MPLIELSPLWISLNVTLAATFFASVIGIILATGIYHYPGKGKAFIDAVFTLPLVLPPTVVGFFLLLLLGRTSPIGQFLDQIGLPFLFTWRGAVSAATVVAVPLMYKTVLTAFEQVDSHLIDAARTLGASPERIFIQILLPLAWQGVVNGSILTFARALGEFGATLMLAGSIPGKTQTMPIAIYFAVESGNLSQALVWVIITLLIALIAITSINVAAQSRNSAVAVAGKPWSRVVGYWLLNHSGYFADATKKASKANLTLNKLEYALPNFSLRVSLISGSHPLGILGESGAGKTQLLRCIAGLETPTKGGIYLGDRILFDADKGINLPCDKRRIGFLQQNYALFPHLTVAENIAFGLQHLPTDQRQTRINTYLQRLQLEGLGSRFPNQLSGGQQQRVALGRALAIEPEILLLDEPLSALDTYLRHQIEQILIDVLSNYSGVTLFVTHKLEEIYRVCQNILVLSQGNVIACDRKETIFHHPPSYQVAKVTECKNFSRVKILNNSIVEAIDWHCQLRVTQPITESLTYLGFRAHHFSFPTQPNQENTFPCWLSHVSETQHRMTLYLHLNTPPPASGEYHLQAEIFREKWQILRQQTFPWHVHLAPERIILMEY